MTDFSGNVIDVTNSEFEELLRVAKAEGWRITTVEVKKYNSGYRVLLYKPEKKVEPPKPPQLELL